nr:Cation efflux system protein CusA [Klebsiella pneumoniae]
MRDKLETLKASLPEGVEIVTTYDRSQLIDRAIDNLSYKLLEEFIVVAVVCALFLWHVRSARWRLFLCHLACVSPLSSCTSRTERQYHVAGRDSDCRRCDGGCRHCDD